MNLKLPADIEANIEGFLMGRQYADELAVLREALHVLKRRDDLAAIREGIADSEAGRLRPAREVLAEVRQRLDRKRRENSQPKSNSDR